MSYVDGTDLATLLGEEDRLSIPRSLKITRGICDGLVAAHAAGVVHRDLKPANVMVDRADDALITDFGIARLTTDRHAELAGTELESPATPAPVGFGYSGLTRVGSVVGTIEYMPPEQARGAAITERADVYSLGLILYDLLTGRARLKNAQSAMAELEARKLAPPPGVRSLFPEVPAALDAVITRCLQPDPAQRFKSSAELAAALARLDNTGHLLPVQRTIGLPRVLAAAAVALAAIGTAWWYFRPPPAPVAHDPVSVVIADLDNLTGDPTFDHTLEPVLKLSLETAEFITAYARTDVRRALGVAAPDRFDAPAATELAVSQGLGVVLTGSIERDGSRFRLRISATQPITGTVVDEATATASDKGAVLAATGRLADEIREALGDDESDAQQRFAMDTLTAVSLDVVREYAAAMDALASSRFEEARTRFQQGVALDPQFGLAYAGLSIASANLGNQQDAERYASEAMRHVDRMTERERFRTRGLYYYVTADYPSCSREYGALVERFSADTAARNNLALCATRLRDMKAALEQMRAAVEILPNRSLYRVNLALYSAYAGNFEEAEEAARTAREMSPFGYVPLGFAQLALGRLSDARATLEEFSRVEGIGPSHSASALADIAIYEGRYDEAVQILERGVAADLEAMQPDRAAAKLAAIAYAESSRGQHDKAVAAARRAIEQAPTAKIHFLAARVFATAGAADEAAALAKELGSALQNEPRAYGKIIEGEIALASGDARSAIDALNAANGLLDTWIGRFTLGRAYLEAGAFAQADSEFDRCMTRRGEALALFLDEEPTFGFTPSVAYFQGRVREGLRTASFADSYRRYLEIRGAAGEDPLLEDVRRRLAAAAPQ
jgi:tetratricopeptide (TPR) repeat protein